MGRRPSDISAFDVIGVTCNCDRCKREREKDEEIERLKKKNTRLKSSKNRKKGKR